MNEKELEEPKEPGGEGAFSTVSPQASISLQQAIDFGEYDPQALANFSEWHTLSGHIQWQLIRKALDVRQRQLISQYAELNNVLCYSKKPNIHEACKSVEKQLQVLAKDREKLYAEYSEKMAG